MSKYHVDVFIYLNKQMMMMMMTHVRENDKKCVLKL